MRPAPQVTRRVAGQLLRTVPSRGLTRLYWSTPRLPAWSAISTKSQLPQPIKVDDFMWGWSKKMLMDQMFRQPALQTCFIIEFAEGGQTSVHDHNFEEGLSRSRRRGDLRGGRKRIRSDAGYDRLVGRRRAARFSSLIAAHPVAGSKSCRRNRRHKTPTGAWRPGTEFASGCRDRNKVQRRTTWLGAEC